MFFYLFRWLWAASGISRPWHSKASRISFPSNNWSRELGPCQRGASLVCICDFPSSIGGKKGQSGKCHSLFAGTGGTRRCRKDCLRMRGISAARSSPLLYSIWSSSPCKNPVSARRIDSLVYQSTRSCDRWITWPSVTGSSSIACPRDRRSCRLIPPWKYHQSTFCPHRLVCQGVSATCKRSPHGA